MANNFKGKDKFLAKDNFYKNSSDGFDRLGYATTSKFSIERKRKSEKYQRISIITTTE